MCKVSFVIPCYRSERTIEMVVREITDAMKEMNDFSYEVILVNDASPDNVWQIIKALSETDQHIVGVNLAKNFGQHSALMAGYHFVTGDIVVSLDDDGQTPADEAPKLIQKICEGYDVVYARYKKNMESPFRRFGSKVNSKMAEYMIGKPKNIAIQSYYAARRFVVDEIIKYENSYPYIFGLVFRTTKNIGNVEVNHRSRSIGTSGYTLPKLIGLWMNGFTAFSIKPLRIATVLGIVSSIVGFLLGMFFVIRKFIVPTVPLGYSSIISAVMLIGGLNLLMLGVVGEYIGRIYICINRSPQFVVKETVGKDN